MKRNIASALFFLIAASVVVWLLGSNNAYTPAGYVGYVQKGAILGKSGFIGTQVGPTSTGRGWLLDVVNVSITPYTYDELFNASEGTAVLSKDHMQVSFGVHIVFNIDSSRVQEFLEKYSTMDKTDTSHAIVKTAYANFIKERLRTFARDAIQKFDWQELTDNIDAIGTEVQGKVLQLTKDTPFNVQSVVVGNIQFPQSVAESVADAQTASQVLARKKMEIQQAEADAQKRVAEAKGVADAMDIINQKLTPSYIQYEAIQAQQTMINSPNHTVIYIPVGNNGVPVVSLTPPATDQAK